MHAFSTHLIRLLQSTASYSTLSVSITLSAFKKKQTNDSKKSKKSKKKNKKKVQKKTKKPKKSNPKGSGLARTLAWMFWIFWIFWNPRFPDFFPVSCLPLLCSLAQAKSQKTKIIKLITTPSPHKEKGSPPWEVDLVSGLDFVALLWSTVMWSLVHVVFHVLELLPSCHKGYCMILSEIPYTVYQYALAI